MPEENARLWPRLYRHAPIRSRADAVTVITPQQVQLALELVEPQSSYTPSGLSLVAERANNELAVWGHAGHEVALERVIPYFGDPRVL